MNPDYHLTFLQPAKSAIASFQAAMVKKLSDRAQASQLAYISPENIFHYQHGNSWSLNQDEVGEMTSHTAEMAIHFRDIKDWNISIVNSALSGLHEDLQQQFSQSFFSMINETCERSGQTVSTKDKQFPEAFLEAFEKLQFSVNEQGEVELPTIAWHDPKALVKQLMAEGERFAERFEKIKEEKSRQALEDEQRRKAKFKRREA